MITTFTDMAIDTIQTGKKAFINTTIKNDSLNKILTDFVDIQTEVTKKMVHTTFDTVAASFAILSNKDFQQQTFQNCFMPFGGK